MKQFIILLSVLFIVSNSFAQQIPFSKRSIGNYYGVQPEYTVILDGNAIYIPEESQTIRLNYPDILLETGTRVFSGNYSIAAETKDYYAFQVRLDNGIIEEWRLYKKGKQLLRLGKTPRPEVTFTKK